MRALTTLLTGSLALTLAACAATTTPTAKVEEAKQEVAVDLNNDDLYEVHHDGRLYVFDDFDTYQGFLAVGETSFRQTFIGAGPEGETLVFGMTGKDKKKPYNEIAGYNLYEGNLKAADHFYGETRMDGRIYVFDRLEDMEAVRATGEAPLRYTEIGAGPKGETIVYVLRSDNKKVKPVALQAEFKKHNNMG